MTKGGAYNKIWAMKKRTVYLDHNATSPLSQEAFDAMKPFFGEIYGNASSIHFFGQKAKKALEDAREKISSLLNAAAPQEIIFTGGGTESDNLALQGVALACRGTGNHIILSSIEHPAVLKTCEYLKSTKNFDITYLPVDSYGLVNPEDVQRSITPETILISIMHANNEVGAIEPIDETGALIENENNRRHSLGQGRIFFHTDAVQSAGKITLDVQKLRVDLLSISAHKFYGPKGVGALYIKKGTPVEPLFYGGHHERNVRPGTENIAAIAGMARALELAQEEQPREQARILALRQKLEQGIINKIPHVTINGHSDRRLAGTLNVAFKFIEGEGLVLMLDLEGIAVSSGSACASGSPEPSHVLKAMNVDPEFIQGALRFSLGRHNSEEDIDYVLDILQKSVARLREISPIYK